MESPFRVRKLADTATPWLLGLLALGVRALPWRLSLDAARVHFYGNDAYYHARRILYSTARFPEHLSFDPYLNFPHGGEPIWTPLFDLAAAALVRVTVGPDPDAMERLLVWLPPLLGALTVGVVALGARAHFGRRAGLLAGLLLALLPAHVEYTRVGYLDHHAAVSLASALLLLGGMRLLERWTRAARPAALPEALGMGGLVGASLLLWPGMVLEVVLLEAAFAIALVTRTSTSDARALALGLVVLHVVACAVVVPFAWGRHWIVWGTFAPVVLSGFQPWLLGSLALVYGVWALLPGKARPTRSALSGFARLGALAGLLGVASLVLLPELRGSWGQAWTWFAKRETFQATVRESRPLLGAGGWAELRSALEQLSLWLPLLPFCLAYALRRLRRSPSAPLALLVWWSSALGLATLVQMRFQSAFAVALALLVAWCLDRFVAAAAPRLPPRAVAWAPLAILLVSLAPSWSFYAPHLRDALHWWQGRPPELEPHLQRKRLLVDVADWLRRHSEETSGYLDASRRPEYGVLSGWPDGHILEYVARRPTVVDNFGDDLGSENMRLAEEYYLADEPRASELLDALGVRYVVFEYRPMAGRRNAGPRSMLTRLYFRDGAEADRSLAIEASKLRSVDEPLPAVERHRLVMESAPKPWTGFERAAFKVYEHVAGALLVGSAQPGARVEARLALRTNRGRRFEFVASTRADPEGRWELRFPYSTRGAPPSVRPAERLELRSDGALQRVSIGEQDVLGGRTVRVPPFAPGGAIAQPPATP